MEIGGKVEIAAHDKQEPSIAYRVAVKIADDGNADVKHPDKKRQLKHHIVGEFFIHDVGLAPLFFLYTLFQECLRIFDGFELGHLFHPLLPDIVLLGNMISGFFLHQPLDKRNLAQRIVHADYPKKGIGQDSPYQAGGSQDANMVITRRPRCASCI